MKQWSFLFFFIPLCTFAQMSDDFSDGNFTHNPPWTGHTNDFIINTTLQLQLNASQPGSSYLSTENQLIDSTEWIFQAKLSFSPSDNNHAKIYLISNQQELNIPLNGYYLQLGTSGSDDAPSLYRQDGTQHTLICSGIPGSVASSFDATFKITRNASGYWQIFSAPENNGLFQFQGAGTDNTYTNSTWFGVFAQYTTSNTSKFFFDNFIIQPLTHDTTAPLIETILPLSSTTLRLTFNEPIQQIPATTTTNYWIDHNIGEPFEALWNNNSPNQIKLNFLTPFPLSTYCNIVIVNQTDTAGNIRQKIDTTFIFHQPQTHDIIITEIMADPDPPILLPPVEFIELYNRSDFPVNLKNWSLTLGSTEKTFPQYSIQPQQYVIITSDEQLNGWGQILQLFSSPSSLANTGTTLILKDTLNQIIHAIEYSKTWYHDPAKENGGWSIEMIDPQNPCGDETNWSVSQSNQGGTPGQINSIHSINPDQEKPIVKTIDIKDPSTVQITFSESLDSATLIHPSSYSIKPGNISILSINANTPFYQHILLNLSTPLEQNILYELSINGNITDCANNPIEHPVTYPLAIPQPPDIHDIQLNEILFDPVNEECEFIELVNTSNKIISLKSLYLCKFNTEDTTIVSAVPVHSAGGLLFPNQYIALCKNSTLLQHYYPCPYPENLITVNDFPSLSNTGAFSGISNISLNIIDILWYDNDLHFPLLADYEGISLEKINPNNASFQPNNWHSAAQTSGFATPGYENSQFIQLQEAEQSFFITPEIFSPDMDGYHDLMQLHYQLETPENMINFSIFDANGQLIYSRNNNILTGYQGVVTWNGTDNNGNLMPSGIYIILIDLFTTNGQSKRIKKTTVLGTKH